MRQMKRLPYDRADRVGDLILRVLSTVSYNDIEDPRMKGIQFTGVKVTKDLQIANVYYFISGDELVKKACTDSLLKHAGAFRHALAQEMTTKFLPSLKFFYDESVEHGEKIDALIATIHDKP